ncbi:sulfotransferase [Streptomyces sp. GC420]|uniref:sulfotransferase family protein n=1 Tax=Streptomyces sp. GC420 TaxID=2697568 RepID=UPI0014150AF2|nr:sulfotransferase [Streptomyces sp. GC420]NBM20007.1 sulfotransferase [Streptomyces sp. GC420]
MSTAPEQAPAPLFVTGTGRCGSTLVSGLLREHPQVLSLSELFNHLTDMYRLTASVFPEGTIGAARFWKILSARNAVNGIMSRNGISPREILYPADRGARYTAETGVPALLLTTLPHLTDDPDALYDEIAEAVAGFPDAVVGDHYTRLFGLLCDRFGKRLWAERSGGSLILTGQYAQHFPEARFLHIVRDGRDCALSMSRHRGFRMAAVVMALGLTLGQDPYAMEDPGSADLRYVPEDLLPFLPDRFDARAFEEYEVPAALFGAYWSDEMRRGMEALSVLPEDRVMHVWYEDILDHPEESLARIAAFLGPEYADDAWVRRSAALVGRPGSAWQALPGADQADLDEACRPGLSVLAAHGVTRLSGRPVGSHV